MSCCRSSGVEHSLGKGEAESSNLSDSTIFTPVYCRFDICIRSASRFVEISRGYIRFGNMMSSDMTTNYGLPPRLALLRRKSYLEEGYSADEIPPDADGRDICLYPRSFVDRVAGLDRSKSIDFNFRGALRIDPVTRDNRKWVGEFAIRNFTDRSYFQATDKRSKSKRLFGGTKFEKLGEFDFTFERDGFVPKEHRREDRAFFDEEYFSILSRSEFTLCPAGDAPWSMRFFEAILAGSIPVVENSVHSGRNPVERGIGYQFAYADADGFVYDPEWAENNLSLFIKNQTLLD